MPGSRQARLATGLALVMWCLCASPAVVPVHAQTWEDLEARGAVIAGIDIVVTDVFDVTKPSENHWLGRAANALHLRTRRTVVARELLFRSGDAVDASRVRETERNLRRYRFIRDSRIVPVPIDDGTVKARVEVFDAWSLDGGVSLDRAGGNTAWSVRLDDGNLLGFGKRVVLAHSEDLERTTNEISYTDPQLFRSRWTTSVGYADLSDGRSRALQVGRPFFALDTPYALSVGLRSAEFDITQYDGGAAVYRMAAHVTSASVSGARAWRIGDHTVWRTGAVYAHDDNDYADPTALMPTSLVPPAHTRLRLRGLAWTSTVFQDRSATFEQLATIGRTEDYNLGWTLTGHGGLYLPALGSDRRAPFMSVSVRKAWRALSRGLVLVDAAYSGRHEVRRWHDAVGIVRVTAYDRSLPWQTLAARFDVSSVTRPDPGHWIYLGGSDGLRGYVDHLAVGDRRIRLSFDDRIITGWRPLGLVQVGFVAYGDAGAIRRLDTGRWTKLYANVGAGLRFGSVKSAGGGLAQVSIAMPLVREAGMDRVQLVLGNVVGF